MISDNIILGGREESENSSLLKKFGVSHVLNVAQQAPICFPQDLVYLKIPLLGEFHTWSLLHT